MHLLFKQLKVCEQSILAYKAYILHKIIINIIESFFVEISSRR